MITKSQTQSSEALQSREEDILSESTRVFARNGFRTTDVQVVADALGIGKGTIYRAFPTKQELFLACADRAMRRLQDSIQAASSAFDDPIERLKAAIRAYFKFFDDNPELIELIIQERSEFKDRTKPTYFEYRDRSLQPWIDMFSGLAKTGSVRDVRPEKITDFISQQLYGKLFTHYFSNRSGSIAEGADEVIDFLFYGFMADQNKTDATT
jgi:AcrR family transcriptional regulator